MSIEIQYGAKRKFPGCFISRMPAAVLAASAVCLFASPGQASASTGVGLAYALAGGCVDTIDPKDTDSKGSDDTSLPADTEILPGNWDIGGTFSMTLTTLGRTSVEYSDGEVATEDADLREWYPSWTEETSEPIHIDWDPSTREAVLDYVVTIPLDEYYSGRAIITANTEDLSEWIELESGDPNCTVIDTSFVELDFQSEDRVTMRFGEELEFIRDADCMEALANLKEDFFWLGTALPRLFYPAISMGTLDMERLDDLYKVSFSEIYFGEKNGDTTTSSTYRTGREKNKGKADGMRMRTNGFGRRLSRVVAAMRGRSQ